MRANLLYAIRFGFSNNLLRNASLTLLSNPIPLGLWTLHLFQNDWTGTWVNGSLRLGLQARLNLQLFKVVILIMLAFNSYCFGFNLTNVLRYLVELSNQRVTHRYKGSGSGPA